VRPTTTDSAAKKLGGSATPLWRRALQLRILHQMLLSLGHLEEAVRIIAELESLAMKIGQAYSVALCLSTRTWMEFGKELDLTKLEAGFQEMSKSDANVRFLFWEVFSEVQLSLWISFAAIGQVLYRMPKPRPTLIR
jgi:hypothetical protein